jgi:hypothetical protein
VLKTVFHALWEKGCYKITVEKVYTDKVLRLVNYRLKIIAKCEGFYRVIVVNESLEKISAHCSRARKKL